MCAAQRTDETDPIFEMTPTKGNRHETFNSKRYIRYRHRAQNFVHAQSETPARCRARNQNAAHPRTENRPLANRARYRLCAVRLRHYGFRHLVLGELSNHFLKGEVR